MPQQHVSRRRGDAEGLRCSEARSCGAVILRECRLVVQRGCGMVMLMDYEMVMVGSGTTLIGVLRE